MKNIFYIIIFNLQFVICGNVYSQWVQQNAGITSNILDVEFINRYTGWACGDGSILLKTTNGGLNWMQQNSIVEGKSLFGIHPVNENIVYCVGWFETILKTTNGGTNWIVLRNGPVGLGSSFFEVYFLNSNTGWLLKNYYILRTTNGGQSFDSTQVIYSYLRDIYFKDALTGDLCGDGALIMRTTDGGVNWNKITIPLHNFYLPDFYKVSFINNYGWVVGRGRDFNLGCLSWRTTNFGLSWDTAGRAPYPNSAENYCVYFSSLNTGWCGGSYGYVYKTTNSGFNWIAENTQSNTSFIRSISFYNDSVGWGVGGGGKIIHTTNGGTPVSVVNQGNELPSEFILQQNYPNPFNASTIIGFKIPEKSNVKIILYDISGGEVKVLKNEFLNKGEYKINFNAENLSSGIYIYKIEAGSFVTSRKMVLVK